MHYTNDYLVEFLEYRIKDKINSNRELGLYRTYKQTGIELKHIDRVMAAKLARLLDKYENEK